MRRLELDEEQVIDLYERYENARQVAETVGCSDETIYRILKRHGVQRTHRHPKEAKSKWVSNCNTKYCPSVVRLYRVICGFSNSEIGKAMGITTNSVCSIMRRRYPDLYESRNRLSEADIDAIEHEYLAGSTSYELGDRYKVNHTTISKVMRKRGHHRGKGNGPTQQQSSNLAMERFLESYTEESGNSDTWRHRAAVRRRYRIISRPHDGGTYGLKWKDVYKHNGHDLTCWICKKKCRPNSKNRDMRPSVDHVIPLSNGGTDTFDNVRIAHVGCNRNRSNKVQLTFDYLTNETG